MAFVFCWALFAIAVATVPSLRWGLMMALHRNREKGEYASSQHAAESPETPAPDRPASTAASADQGSTASAEPQAAEPPAVVTREKQTDQARAVAEQQAVKKAVKEQVITRIDSMPIASANKDRLYAAVEKARVMRKILTIPFISGRTDLAATDIKELKTQLDDPELKKLRDDPTAVFVILGYTDPKGDPVKNKVASQKRADAVRDAIRDKCDVENLSYTLGMGGSKLLDAQNLEKNRIVEIWVVLP